MCPNRINLNSGSSKIPGAMGDDFAQDSQLGIKKIFVALFVELFGADDVNLGRVLRGTFQVGHRLRCERVVVLSSSVLNSILSL